MRSAIIKQASQDAQQNQTTTTINYIQSSMFIYKKKRKTKSK